MSTLPSSSADDTTRSSVSRLPQLKTGNFRVWYNRLKIYVGAHGKSAVLAGTPIQAYRPAEEAQEDFAARVAKREEEEFWVLNVIFGTIDEANAAFVEAATTAKEAIDALQAHHGATKYASVFSLLKELFDCKLLPGGDLNAHLSKLRRIQNGLAEYGTRPALVSTSVVPSSSPVIDLSIPDSLYAAIILFSLPPSYNVLRSNIFSDPDGKLNSAHVYERVLNEAATSTDDLASGVSALAVTPTPPSRPSRPSTPTTSGAGGSNKPTPVCGHCGNAHQTEKCRKKALLDIEDAIKAGALVRDANGRLSKGRSVPGASAVVSPFFAQPSIASPNSFTPLDSSALHDPLDVGYVPGLAVTLSDQQAVSALATSAAPSFFLDSGAGANMVGDGSLLTEVKSINPITVTAAGGSPLVATSSGTLRLVTNEGRHVSLSDVLVVPGLHLNLVSVARITYDRSHSVTFAGNSASILDSNGTTLARAMKEGQIYRLLTSTFASLT